MSKANQLETILAREIITLAEEHAQDISVAESVSEICFTMLRLFEELGYDSGTSVDWSALFNAYDKRFVALKNGEHVMPDESILKMLKRMESMIVDQHDNSPN